jgi:NDP-sugar pyrophosphorylase family protein
MGIPIGQNCSIGNFRAIDDDCIIGRNTVIGDRVGLKNCVVFRKISRVIRLLAKVCRNQKGGSIEKMKSSEQ